MKTSEQINAIATALAKAQQEIRPAVKDSANPAFRSRFAGMTSIWESIREPLSKNGLSVCQDVTSNAEGVSVETRIFHMSGQWVEFGPLTVPLAKRDAHGMGSAATYGRRYAILGALGIVSDDDDDGQAAQASAPQHAPVPQQSHQSQPAQSAPAASASGVALVSEKQSKLLWVKLNKECEPEFRDQVMRSLKHSGISDLKFVPASMMNGIMEEIMKHVSTKGQPPAPAAQPPLDVGQDDRHFEDSELPF